MDSVLITQQLLTFDSVTPYDNGAIDYLANILKDNDFVVEVVEFHEEGHASIKNMFAKYGEGDSLCFAGHTDVVPTGDPLLWKFSPFSGQIHDGKLYGRGAVDMKGAIGAFVYAALNYKNENPAATISLMITGDEEAESINGTEKLLKYLDQKGEKFKAVIVGEPTNPNKLGEMIKIGRRGSVSFKLEIEGVEGHVAYPHLADNPITKLVEVLHSINSVVLDNGNKNFMPSNLEVVKLEVNNKANNVIPKFASATFNIRFNDLHTSIELKELLAKLVEETTTKYKLDIINRPSESFITQVGEFAISLADVVETVTGIKPEFSTTGGTSDARFIKQYAPVIEFGLINQLAHKVDEHVDVADLEKLSEIYYKFLQSYFK